MTQSGGDQFMHLDRIRKNRLTADRGARVAITNVTQRTNGIAVANFPDAGKQYLGDSPTAGATIGVIATEKIIEIFVMSHLIALNVVSHLAKRRILGRIADGTIKG